MNRSSRNRDSLKRLNYPRQTYAFSGIDWGEAPNTVKTRKKLNINNAPMIITPMPPGANASSNALWQQTYGASMDCVMSLIDGEEYNANIVQSNFEFFGVYNEALPTSSTDNIYQVLDGKQQVQFIAGKSDVKTFRKEAATPILPVDVRTLGMRAPIQMCGWGHTVGMRPTDPEPQFSRRNDNEHKFDRSSWKIGPLDARWCERRRIWRAFNDLIADDASQNLGTLVFSTNPDDACGFPYLRGKLEDVWSVRRTFREMGTTPQAKEDDVTKSAMLTTKLDSYFLSGNKIASLNEVLVIHNDCFSGLEGVCGAETTTEAEMAIQAAASFRLDDVRIGPVGFVADSVPSNVTLGHMYFDSGAADGSPSSCVGLWRPGVVITPGDICDIGAQQFDDIWSNDMKIAFALEGFCSDVMKALEELDFRTGGMGGGVIPGPNVRELVCNDITADLLLVDRIEELIDAIDGAFTTIEEWTAEIIEEITFEVQNSMANAFAGINQALGDAVLCLDTVFEAWVNALLQALIDQINACLPEDCQVSLPTVERATCVVSGGTPYPLEMEAPIDLSADRAKVNAAKPDDAKIVYELLQTFCTEPPVVPPDADDPLDIPGFEFTIDDPCSGDVENIKCEGI